MSQNWFVALPLKVFDDDTVYAADLNNAMNSIEAAFDLVAVDVTLPVEAVAICTAAVDTVNQFYTVYLGAFAVDPTLDNEGNALVTGATYWNTVSNHTRTYNGITWEVVYVDAGDYVTYTGSDEVVSTHLYKDCGSVYVDKGNSGTTTQTLDYTAGSHQKITVTGAHTIATSNWPPTGNLGELLLELINGAAYTITWPTVNWIKTDGTVTTVFSSNGITLQTTGTDFIVLWSRDAGTTIYGKVIR